MPSDEPSRPYNWRPKSLAKLEMIYSSFANAKHLLRRSFDPTKSLHRGEGLGRGNEDIKRKCVGKGLQAFSMSFKSNI